MARKSKYEEKTSEKVWKAALYARLSKEDGDKGESDSILNQKQLLKEYTEAESDIEFVDFYIDDGFSGTNFERPSFNAMLEDIKKGKINCVVVKDLSRLGRNYVEVGKYLETIFPMLNVRFIAVTDNLDSFKNPSSMNNLIVPFKNIINDEYCRDISNKIKASLTLKRKQGKFIGSFAPYGYEKDPQDHGKLLVNEEQAKIVRKIFAMFLSGTGLLQIARTLNAEEIPSPAMEKNSLSGSLWCSKTIRRILTSQVYIGNMVQGVSRNKSYKLKKSEAVSPKDWIVVKNTHEAIISQEEFENATELLERDTRTPPGKKEVYLFSGFLKCGDCGRAMNRKTIKQPYGVYEYYICSTYKKHGADYCTKHTVKADELLKAVTETVKQQIMLAVDLKKAVDKIKSEVKRTDEREANGKLIYKKKSELQKCEKMLVSLYSDWKVGEITKEEYDIMKLNFLDKAEKLKKSISDLEEKLLSDENEEEPEILTEFLNYENFSELNREILSALVKNIYIYENNEIKIEFKYSDQFESAASFTESRKTA